MKRTLIILLAVGLLVGCGKKETAKEFQGVTSSGKNYIQQGMVYLNQSDVPRAIQSFDQAIKEDPKNADNYIVLGQVYLRLNQFARAVDTLNAASRVDPNNGEVHYLRATALGLKGDSRPQAIEAAQKSVELFMQQKDEERFKKAIALLKSLSESDPVSADVIPQVKKPQSELETVSDNLKNNFE